MIVDDVLDMDLDAMDAYNRSWWFASVHHRHHKLQLRPERLSSLFWLQLWVRTKDCIPISTESIVQCMEDTVMLLCVWINRGPWPFPPPLPLPVVTDTVDRVLVFEDMDNDWNSVISREIEFSPLEVFMFVLDTVDDVLYRLPPNDSWLSSWISQQQPPSF